MATAWSEIIRLAMVRIEDVRWNDELSISPAIFYRAKSDFVNSAIPMQKCLSMHICLIVDLMCMLLRMLG